MSLRIAGGRAGRPVAEQLGELPPPPRHVEARRAGDVVCRTERARELLGFRPTVDVDVAEST